MIRYPSEVQHVLDYEKRHISDVTKDLYQRIVRLACECLRNAYKRIESIESKSSSLQEKLEAMTLDRDEWKDSQSDSCGRYERAEKWNKELRDKLGSDSIGVWRK